MLWKLPGLRQIEIVFDYITEKGTSSEKAFQVFEKYFHEHLEMFNDDVVARIYHTAGRLASVFHEETENDHAALTRLHLLLGREYHVF